MYATLAEVNKKYAGIVTNMQLNTTLSRFLTYFFIWQIENTHTEHNTQHKHITEHTTIYELI